MSPVRDYAAPVESVDFNMWKKKIENLGTCGLRVLFPACYLTKKFTLAYLETDMPGFTQVHCFFKKREDKIEKKKT